MNQITDIILTSTMTILSIVIGMAVTSFKKYLIAKGGKKAVEVAEILAKNAVNATEQVADSLEIKGEEKLDHAKKIIVEGLKEQNIVITESQINNFIESAVKQMNDSWRGDLNGNSK